MTLTYMKKLIISIAILAAMVIPSPAPVLRFLNSNYTQIYTNVTFSSNITANVTFTNQQNTPDTIYHTFQFINNSAGTNTTTVNLDRTIDQVNWFPVSTNTVTRYTNIEYTATGEWFAYRWRVAALATNTTITALYMSR